MTELKTLNKGLLFTLMILTTSCASPPREQGKYTSEFNIPDSFLRQQARQTEQEALPDERTERPAFSVVDIPSMATLQRGSPLLMQMPVFASREPIQVALNEMEVPQLAHYIFGDLLKLNYVLSTDVERMREKLALNLQKEVTPAELFQLAREVMAQQSVEVYTKDNIVYVARRSGRTLSRSVGIGSTLDDLPESGDDLIQLVPFTFNSSRGITNIVSKLTNATVVPDNTNRLLIVEGTRADVERVLQIVAMLDVPHARGRDIRMLSLAFLSPQELVDQINAIMQAEGLVVNEDASLVALNRINSVVVYAANKTVGDRIAMWAQTLDVSTGGEAERFFVYRPQFAKAADLAKSLKIFTANPQVEEPAPAGAAGARTAGRQADRLTIEADEQQNALIIRATPSRYREMLNLLQQLDRLPGQVALQVIVAEVELSDNQSTGIDWFYNSVNNFDKSVSLNLTSGSGTLALAAVKGDWRVALNMLARQTDLRVLSRPYLVVRDGESANINSGQQVPVVTETSSNDQNPDRIRTAVQYRSTGISLSVTPVINADGLVSLQISQETSKSEPTQGFEVATPTILTRNISTSVLAADGQTIVLGGLIKEDITDIDSKVPVLGSIPVLGRLFRTKGENFSRTELLVMITPRIVRNTSELDEFGRKLAEMYSFPVNP
ncbi:MAG: secretin N-terminal domain-containing protein [Alishewanella aestuarii]